MGIFTLLLTVSAFQFQNMNNSSTPVAEPVPEVDMVPPVVGESDDPLWFSDMASGNGLFSQVKADSFVNFVHLFYLYIFH